MKKPFKSAVSLLVLSLGLSSSQASEVSENLSLAAHINLTVNELACRNSRGPQITLEGNITLGSVCTKVIFSNNAKGTHTLTVVREVGVVLSLGETITLPKQPSRGGVGGNPFIYLQFTDVAGNPLSDELLLGRCVQGLNVSADLLNQTLAHLNVEATSCSNKGGPFITLDGTLTLSGLRARLIFRNNAKGTHTAEAKTDVSLIAEGVNIVIPKQPVRGGVGGNPWISIQFVDCVTGAALAEPVNLGRCNQL